MTSHHFNFTDRTRKVLALAREEAMRLRHDYIGTEHILLGLIIEGEGVAVATLMNLDLDLKRIRKHVDDSIRVGNAQGTELRSLTYTSGGKSVLEHALSEAQSLRHNYVGTEHLLLGLLREQNGIAAQVLESLGMTLERTRDEILKILGHGF